MPDKRPKPKTPPVKTFEQILAENGLTPIKNTAVADNTRVKTIPSTSGYNGNGNTKAAAAANAKVIAGRKALIAKSKSGKMKDAAVGEKFRFFPNDADNVIDEYLNPLKMIGDMADNIGRTTGREPGNRASLGEVAMAFGMPLGIGALAGLGTKNTSQFINNILNPAAGMGPKKAGNKTFKYDPSKSKEWNIINEGIHNSTIYNNPSEFIMDANAPTKGVGGQAIPADFPPPPPVGNQAEMSFGEFIDKKEADAFELIYGKKTPKPYDYTPHPSVGYEHPDEFHYLDDVSQVLSDGKYAQWSNVIHPGIPGKISPEEIKLAHAEILEKFKDAKFLSGKDIGVMIRQKYADRIPDFKAPITIDEGKRVRKSQYNTHDVLSEHELDIINKHKYDVEKFNPQENNLIDAYTHGYDATMNNVLRHPNTGLLEDQVRTMYNGFNEQLNTAIQKNKFQEPTVVHRGINNDYDVPLVGAEAPYAPTGVVKKRSALQPGDVFKDDGFLSTTLAGRNSWGGGNLAEEIIIPGGSKQSFAFPNANSFAQHKNEMEAILPKGLVRKVEEVRDPVASGTNTRYRTSILNPYNLIGGAAGAGVAASILNNDNMNKTKQYAKGGRIPQYANGAGIGSMFDMFAKFGGGMGLGGGAKGVADAAADGAAASSSIDGFMGAGMDILGAATNKGNYRAGTTGKAIGSGAGAVLGSIIPGVGTAIGSSIGGALGGFIGGQKDKKNMLEDTTDDIRDAYRLNELQVNMNKQGTQFEDGGMVAPEQQEMPMEQSPQVSQVNIQKGELMVDPRTGKIIRKFTNPNRYSKHEKKQMKEPIGNFVTLPDGMIIIPKKFATRYERGDQLTQSSIMKQLMSDQANDPFHNTPEDQIPSGTEQFGDGGMNGHFKMKMKGNFNGMVPNYMGMQNGMGMNMGMNFMPQQDMRGITGIMSNMPGYATDNQGGLIQKYAGGGGTGPKPKGDPKVSAFQQWTRDKGYLSPVNNKPLVVDGVNGPNNIAAYNLYADEYDASSESYPAGKDHFGVGKMVAANTENPWPGPMQMPGPVSLVPAKPAAPVNQWHADDPDFDSRLDPSNPAYAQSVDDPNYMAPQVATPGNRNSFDNTTNMPGSESAAGGGKNWKNILRRGMQNLPIYAQMASAMQGDPFLAMNTNTAYPDALSLANQMPEDISIAGNLFANDQGYQNSSQQINNNDTPSARAEAGELWGRKLAADNQAYQGKNQIGAQMRSQKLNQILGITTAQGADNANARNTFMNEQRMDQSARENAMMAGMVNLSKNNSLADNDNERIKAINEVSKFVNVNPYAKKLIQEDPMAGAYILDYVQSGNGTIEQAIAAYGRESTKTTTTPKAKSTPKYTQNKKKD